MVLDININEVIQKHVVPLSKISNGTSVSCQGSKVADMGETCSYTDFLGQEYPPMNDVALFGGAHIRKESGICCCVHDALITMHLYMHVDILYMGTINAQTTRLHIQALCSLHSQACYHWNIHMEH